MARINRAGFLAIAVVFHLIYIYSIFDIYFVSPIVHGMREFRVQRPEGVEAPAKRVVLIVGDGLRADKAFQFFPDPSPADPSDPDSLTPRPLAPFLRSRVLSHGTFGVSHTRVPTESRPGHVALIAGLYEDVSAVMTGWKLNPVNFDSVFNRSRHTWSWGSPDILPMFKEGAVPGRVDADMYGEEDEDYTQDASKLDTWVFDKVKAFFGSATTNSILEATLHEDGIVLFLHLLGLDTTGHAYRPYSKEYLHNIKVVDQGVQEITELIENYYDDGKTAFVFTADHGMSDWGSHGDGHPDNTRTPLIAWGSGVAKPVVSDKQNIPASGHEDGFSADWHLKHVQRNDVPQADIAALLAYLAGLEFPVNSVGELPLAYLAGDPKEKAEALFVNAQEILEMYRIKELRKRSTVLRYKPFPLLGDKKSSIDHRLAEIRKLIDGDQPEEAIKKSQKLMKLGLEGLRYLQTYDWLFLRTLVTAGYLGWIAFALTTVIDLHVLRENVESSRTPSTVLFFTSILVALYSFLYIQHSPWTYYAYSFFPVMLWEEVVARRKALVAGKHVLFKEIKGATGYVAFGIKCLEFIFLIEALVFGYFVRKSFTAFYNFAGMWPQLQGRPFSDRLGGLRALFWLSCIAMSIFTQIPVVKVESLNQIFVSGALMALVGLLYLMSEHELLGQSKVAGKTAKSSDFSRTVLGLQIGLTTLASIIAPTSAESLQDKEGLPLGNQVVGWIVLGMRYHYIGDHHPTTNISTVSSLLVPFLHILEPNHHYIHRLMIIFQTFAPTFIILTISYEGFFYLAFWIHLILWARMEHQIYKPNNPQVPKQPVPKNQQQQQQPLQQSYRPLTLSDTRIALFFLFYIQSAFFSTGNIASVSSFSLDSVYRLIPVFNPFSQGALLIVKLLIPFVIISANLGILNRRLGVAPSALFMVVMAISDIMTLNFFFLVRDEGSWLDIGTSISHFVISSCLCLFVAALEGVSEWFVRGIDVDDEGEGEKGSDVVDGGVGSDRIPGKEGNANVNGALVVDGRS
ncbi:MAG: Glycosyl phosphatidyl inositol anchor synthesis [Peltula sp. TS41687]|nr:MAG: Glycosyl phosphatidyl inositol anchor synthesis [Peltula sp. TS41687]